jgi:phage terminase small subunit
MAGVPGKSGGPRPNSGGARSGAGRKKKQPSEKSANEAPAEIAERDMLTLLKDIALGRVEATTGQIRAAIAAVQYTHMKKGDGGKKDEEAEKAKKAGAGKFAAAAPPKLVVNNKQ